MTARVVPTLPTFAANSELTSGQMTQLTTWMNYWDNRPMFRMYQSTGQNINTSSWTQVTMDTGTGSGAWDTDSGRSSTSPWSYVIPVGLSGRWNFRWKVGFASNATGVRYSALYQNGATVPGSQFNVSPVSGTTTDMAVGSITVLCNAGDTLAVYAFQSSGSTITTDGGNPSFFEGSFESFANP